VKGYDILHRPVLYDETDRFVCQRFLVSLSRLILGWKETTASIGNAVAGKEKPTPMETRRRRPQSVFGGYSGFMFGHGLSPPV
jgi:hypothetical protein